MSDVWPSSAASGQQALPIVCLHLCRAPCAYFLQVNSRCMGWCRTRNGVLAWTHCVLQGPGRRDVPVHSACWVNALPCAWCATCLPACLHCAQAGGQRRSPFSRKAAAACALASQGSMLLVGCPACLPGAQGSGHRRSLLPQVLSARQRLCFPRPPRGCIGSTLPGRQDPGPWRSDFLLFLPTPTLRGLGVPALGKLRERRCSWLRRPGFVIQLTFWATWATAAGWTLSRTEAWCSSPGGFCWRCSSRPWSA